MNNGDMPAQPQTWVPGYGNKPPVVAGGLTKREHFAAMAMQAILTDGKADITDDSCKKNRVYHAVKIADALLAALEDKS